MLRSPPAGAPASGGFFLGNDGDLALVAFAHALGVHGRVVTQFQVDDAPLGGWHRLQRHGALALHYLFGHAAGHAPELLFAAAAMPFHIDDDVYAFAQLFGNDEAGDVLHRHHPPAASTAQNTHV